jgi:hypothetical protein
MNDLIYHIPDLLDARTAEIEGSVDLKTGTMLTHPNELLEDHLEWNLAEVLRSLSMKRSTPRPVATILLSLGHIY